MQVVCVCVELCVYGYAFHRALRYRAETWDGGRGPTRFESIFSKRPHQGSKVIHRSSCFRNVKWPPNVVGRNLDWSVTDYWGQWSYGDQQGSSRGQSVQECPLATKFGRTNSWRSVVQYWGRRSCRGQPGSTMVQIAQACYIATKFGRKNPWPKCSTMLWSKVMWGKRGSTVGQIV